MLIISLHYKVFISYQSNHFPLYQFSIFLETRIVIRIKISIIHSLSVTTVIYYLFEKLNLKKFLFFFWVLGNNYLFSKLCNHFEWNNRPRLYTCLTHTTANWMMSIKFQNNNSFISIRIKHLSKSSKKKINTQRTKTM